MDLEASIANFEKAGFTVTDSTVNAGGLVEVTLKKADGTTGCKEFYPFTLREEVHTALSNNDESYSDDPSSQQYSDYYVGDRTEGVTQVTLRYLDEVGSDMVFTAKADANFNAGYQTISVVADYAESGSEGMEKTSYIATVIYLPSGSEDAQ